MHSVFWEQLFSVSSVWDSWWLWNYDIKKLKLSNTNQHTFAIFTSSYNAEYPLVGNMETTYTFRLINKHSCVFRLLLSVLLFWGLNQIHYIQRILMSGLTPPPPPGCRKASSTWVDVTLTCWTRSGRYTCATAPPIPLLCVCSPNTGQFTHLSASFIADKLRCDSSVLGISKPITHNDG